MRKSKIEQSRTILGTLTILGTTILGTLYIILRNKYGVPRITWCPQNHQVGGELHRGKIAELTESLKSQGYKIEKEARIEIPSGGFKGARYGDILVTTPAGEQWIIQVGLQTKSGLPISRELKAIQDLERRGFKVEFIPYNK